MVDDRGYPVGDSGAPSPPPPPGSGGPGTAGAPPPPPPSVPGPGPSPDAGWGPSAAPPGGSAGWQAAPSGQPQPWGAESPSAQVGWGRPQQGQNGCLKGCLIVGAILAVLGIVAVVGLGIVGAQLAEQFADNPEALFGGECPYVGAGEVAAALDEDVEVFALEGLADGTMGAILDKRLLADAPDCWVIGDDGTAGRIAVLDGGGAAAYGQARSDAEYYLLREVDGLGDEAFCTHVDAAGSGGVLVRFGERVVYVSMLDQFQDSDNACLTAQAVAATLAP